MISPQELENLWRLHQGFLILVARGRCAAPEDCVQEAFMRLATQRPIPDEPIAWLLRVVRNLALNQSRSARRQRQREQRAAEMRYTEWLSLARPDATELTLDGPQIAAALQKLSDDERDILVAHVWGQLTFRQIAEAFDISHAAAHRRYQQSLEQLRLHLVPRTTSPLDQQADR